MISSLGYWHDLTIVIYSTTEVRTGSIYIYIYGVVAITENNSKSLNTIERASRTNNVERYINLCSNNVKYLMYVYMCGRTRTLFRRHSMVGLFFGCCCCCLDPFRTKCRRYILAEEYLRALGVSTDVLDSRTQRHTNIFVDRMIMDNDDDDDTTTTMFLRLTRMGYPSF